MKKTQEKTKEITYTFLDDFKNKMGEEYIVEIEKIGVNMHLLEVVGAM